MDSAETTARPTTDPTADEILAGLDLSGRTAIVTGASSGVGV
ncbi:MAG TPA: oxidoreductase, partial [Halieaceae bacterium]|nr:oxidoreductase [Halieaceae bacterium]